MSVSDTVSLPDSVAKRLSDELLSLITAEIKSTGAISFARYMELALYAPQLGYYRNTLQKFGKSGDFVTAPEISPLFSHCLANQCAEILTTLHGGDILEFGAGSGVMAADILCVLKEKKQLPDHYYILELSAFLKLQQQKTIQAKIPEFFDRVIWLDQLPEKNFQGVVLANEVLDAMPVHLFRYHNGFQEIGICVPGAPTKPFSYCTLDQPNATLIATLKRYKIAFSENYISEINLYLPAWIKSISDFLSQGVVLIIDYGFPRAEYYHPDRSMGTVMCHYQHRTHSDPFFLPGLQDITAHVDFTAVADSACENGLSVAGFTNQAAFLINCGLLSLLDSSADDKKRFSQNSQVLQLTSPSEMGELFKVIGLTKKYNHELLGFQSMNGVGRL